MEGSTKIHLVLAVGLWEVNALLVVADNGCDEEGRVVSADEWSWLTMNVMSKTGWSVLMSGVGRADATRSCTHTYTHTHAHTHTHTYTHTYTHVHTHADTHTTFIHTQAEMASSVTAPGRMPAPSSVDGGGSAQVLGWV